MLITIPNKLSRSCLFLIVSALLVACQSPSPTSVPPTESLIADTPTPVPATATAVPTPEPQKPAKDHLSFAVLEDITSTNVWALYDSAGSSYWNYALQDSFWPVLFTQSDQRFDFIPSLAADFPSDLAQEDDFWVGSVTMKDGPTWSDGTPITAKDVAFTANTALAFKLGLRWNSAYDPDFLDHVEAADAQTVKFYFKQKPGLSRWQYGALQGKIVNKSYWEPKITDALAIMDEIKDLDPESEEYTARQAEAVAMLHGLDNAGEPTAGAYMPGRWESGESAENVRNPEYYFANRRVEEFANGAYRESIDGKYEFDAYGDPVGKKALDFTADPYYQSILYSVYDPDAAVLALRNGDVDFILSSAELDRDLLTQLQDDSAIKIVENQQNGFRYLAFNHDRPYLSDPTLHQAIACMIDLDFLTQQILQGQAFPVFSPVSPENGFWYNPDVTKFCEGMDTKSRMEEAVRMLADSGYSWETEPAWNTDQGGSVDSGVGLKTPDGKLFPDVTLLAPNPGYDPLRATTALFTEQWMRQLGIPVTAELTNFNNIRTAVYGTGDYDMFILGWGFDAFPLPDQACGLFTSGNPYHYINLDLDELCNSFYEETDLEQAREQMDAIQEILANDLPYIYLFTTPVYDVYRNIDYPFTDILGGIGAGFYGLPAYAMPAGQ